MEPGLVRGLVCGIVGWEGTCGCVCCWVGRCLAGLFRRVIKLNKCGVGWFSGWVLGWVRWKGGCRVFG